MAAHLFPRSGRDDSLAAASGFRPADARCPSGAAADGAAFATLYSTQVLARNPVLEDTAASLPRGHYSPRHSTLLLSSTAHPYTQPLSPTPVLRVTVTLMPTLHSTLIHNPQHSHPLNAGAAFNPKP
eukprot:1561703-Prymnesium_polylepis.1